MTDFHSTLEVMTVGILGMLMVGIWAGISRLHWFIRAVVLLGAIWTLVHIRVYEPAFYFLMMLPIVGICVSWIDQRATRAESLPANVDVKPKSRTTVWLACRLLYLLLVFVSLVFFTLMRTESKWVNWFTLTLLVVVVLAIVIYCIMVIRSGNWLFISFARNQEQHDQKRFRFSIGGIMLATVVVAMMMSLFTTTFTKFAYFDASIVFNALVDAAIVTIAASISYCWRRPARTTNLVLSIAALALLEFVFLVPPMKEISVDSSSGSFSLYFIHKCALVIGVAATTIMMRAVQSYIVSTDRNRNQTVVCGLIVIVFFALLLPVAPVYCYMLGELELPPQDLPATNNCSRVMKTVKELADLNPSRETLAQIKNKTKRERIRELYVEMRKELSKPCFVDFNLDRDGSDEFIGNKTYEILDLYCVADMLDNETKSLIAKGKFDEAALLAMQTIQLGNMHQVGGMTWDSYMAAHIESIGSENFSAMRQNVSIDWTGRVHKQLNQLNREDFEIIKFRSKVLLDRAEGWLMRIVSAAVLILDRKDNWSFTIQYLPDFDSKCRRNDATLRLLKTDVAIRLYVSKMGDLPHTLDDLVPGFLPEVPADPFSDKPLIFRKTMDGYDLYCVGFDGIDNGGRFAISDDVEDEGFDFDLDIKSRTVSMPIRPVNSIAESRPFIQ